MWETLGNSLHVTAVTTRAAKGKGALNQNLQTGTQSRSLSTPDTGKRSNKTTHSGEVIHVKVRVVRPSVSVIT